MMKKAAAGTGTEMSDRNRRLARDMAEIAAKLGMRLNVSGRAGQEVSAELRAYRIKRKHRNRRARHARAVNRRNRK
jgi:hypothetical protein